MSAPSSSSSLGASGSVPGIVVEGLMHRGELAAFEFREARAHAVHTAIVAAAAGALALLGGFAGTFAIAAAVWDRPHRGLILGLVTLAYFLGAAALAWWASCRLRTWRPFDETLYQFSEDYACIHQHLSENSQ